MPGLYGLTSASKDPHQLDPSCMCSELAYARATVKENYKDTGVAMGCVHLGTGGQRALYQSSQAAVLFFGYLTHPVIPPGADENNCSAAARYIHDIYLTHGDAVFSDISGAFALAIWDARTQTLRLANDRLGLRPIYYAEHAGVFRFASEVKGILADPSFPRSLNKSAIAEFIQINFIMGEKTLFEDIHLLPPASILHYRHGHRLLTRYWDVPFPTTYPKHPDRYYDDLIYDSIQSAVKRMTRSTLRYGLSLSGGLDSRWIAAPLAEINPDSMAFTLGTYGSDDTPPAEAVAKSTGLQHYLWDVSPNLVSDLGETYAYVSDGMDSMWHMEEFPLTTRVGDYADVSVGGFLGDGLFGYEINPLSAHLQKKDVTKYRLWRTKESHPSHQVMAQVFKNNMGREFIELSRASLCKYFMESPSDRGFQTIQYYDLRQAERRYANLAQLAKLPFVDIYHPLADEAVVLAALQLPPDQLMFERAYRRAMATHLPEMAKIPWTFTLTPPTISVTGIMLKKFTQLTLGKYLKNTPIGKHPYIRQRRYYVNHTEASRTALRPFIEKTLLSPEMEGLELFNMQGLKDMLQDHNSGRKNSTGFLGVALSLALWARAFYFPTRPTRPDTLCQHGWSRSVR